METLQITKKDNYVIVKLNRPKVNAINRQMVQEIRQCFKALEVDDSVGGVILTGSPHYFTAGLDVIELYQYDKKQIREFFIAFGHMYSELLEFPKPLVCAITGYAPAGGTVLAITADYRVMAEGEQYRLGLNEVAVNIQISQKLVDCYGFWIGNGLAHQYILDGKLLTVDEALSCGLIQESCPLEAVLEQAESKIQHYLKANAAIFVNTKQKLRKSLLDKLDYNAEAELEQALNVWWKPEIRLRMQGLIDRITKK